MNDDHRRIARKVAQNHLDAGDPLGWFEDLYSQAGKDPTIIPWADLKANPNLVDWLDQHMPIGFGFALKVGSGLGDDAEELARRGFRTTAFDISKSAISWSKKRFPQSSVSYIVANLFSAPKEWQSRFQFILESYTLQVLPPDLRPEAIRCIASFVAPNGRLLVISRGRDQSDPEGKMPWPLKKDELAIFEKHGLKQISFEDYTDSEEPPVHRFRVYFVR